jgi:hypothetical protein
MPLIMEIKGKLCTFYNETCKSENELFGPDFALSKDKSNKVSDDGKEAKGAGNNNDPVNKLSLQ